MGNILFLLSHTEKGGGEVVIYNLIKNLNRSQFRPFLGHVDFRKGEFIKEFEKLGLKPIDFGASHLRNLPVTLSVIFRIHHLIKENNIDIVFTTGAHNHVYAALAKRIAPVPIVTYIMNHYQERLKDNPLIMRLALRLKADYYLVPSFSCLKPLKKLIPKNIPYRVIHHGVDKDFIYGEDRGESVRQYLGLKQKNKLISIIGRLQRWKGQDIFLRAASLIAKDYPQVRFCIVGGTLFGMDKDYPDELKNLIDNLGLRNLCWMVGHQNDVRDWISASDIIVHASKTPEPGALVVLEAMSLGKPVVATSCGAPKELIEDGLTGLLCQPNSPEDLAEKVKKILEDEELKERISRNSKDKVSEHFSAERMARHIEEVLIQMVPESVRKKGVLFTLSSCKRAGHEMSMRNILKVIDKEKFYPVAVFLCLNEEGNFPEELRGMGVEVMVRRIGRLRNPLNVLYTVWWLCHLIREKKISLVFSSGGHNHPYSRIASLLTRRPIIAHETFIFKRRFWQNGPIYTLNFLLGTNAYVSCGRLAAESLRRASLWKAPVHYLPYMVDMDIFDYRKSGEALRRHLNIPLDAFVFSMVARIQEWKGQDIFVEAAIEVLKEAPDTYFLVFGEPTFNEDRVYFDSLKKRVKTSGVSAQIIFAGYLEESVYAYAASSVICHSSKTPEPFAMVIIEAFAMKKPVIATTCGGSIEVVEDNVSGWLITPGSIKELALTMKRALKERERLVIMGEQGYQRVREIYNQQQFVSGINSIIAKYIW